MATLPEDIKNGIKELSEAVDVPTKTLLERLKDIMKNDEKVKQSVDEMREQEKDEDKIKEWAVRIAWSVLYNEYASRGNAVECLIKPISSPRANERKIKGEMTWVGDVTALIQRLEKNDAGEFF